MPFLLRLPLFKRQEMFGGLEKDCRLKYQGRVFVFLYMYMFIVDQFAERIRLMIPYIIVLLLSHV